MRQVHDLGAVAEGKPFFPAENHSQRCRLAEHHRSSDAGQEWAPKGSVQAPSVAVQRNSSVNGLTALEPMAMAYATNCSKAW